jgi:hypothetical protein
MSKNFLNGISVTGGAVVVTADAATTVPLTINAVAGATQTANLLTINSPFDYSNNVLTITADGSVNASGSITALSSIAAQGLSVTASGIGCSGILRHSYSAITTSPSPTIFQSSVTGSNIIRLTPTGSFTITAGPPLPGAMCCLIILTSGTTSRTITFGSGFKTPTTTLVTGTVSGKYFVINYVSDGTYLIEISRTAAI